MKNIAQNHHKVAFNCAFNALKNHKKTPLILCVCKGRSMPEISCLYRRGSRHFAESYLQELIGKTYPTDCTLHFIGRIQSKKIKDIVPLVQTLHAVDREKLINLLAQCTQTLKKPITFFIQVNLEGETQKGGCAPHEIDELHSLTRKISSNYLNCVGLMAIPPLNTNKQAYYKTMYTINSLHNLKMLSIGMSDDYVDAIKEGATHVRIGSAFFVQEQTS